MTIRSPKLLSPFCCPDHRRLLLCLVWDQPCQWQVPRGSANGLKWSKPRTFGQMSPENSWKFQRFMCHERLSWPAWVRNTMVCSFSQALEGADEGIKIYQDVGWKLRGSTYSVDWEKDGNTNETGWKGSLACRYMTKCTAMNQWFLVPEDFDRIWTCTLSFADAHDQGYELGECTFA